MVDLPKPVEPTKHRIEIAAILTKHFFTVTPLWLLRYFGIFNVLLVSLTNYKAYDIFRKPEF
jgi:hypothetical protein